MSFDAEAIVVGAGVAGLYAARRIAADGYRVVVLEARDRTGGRILSVSEPTLPVPMELGAEFVHGRSDATLALLREAGSTTLDMVEDDDEEDATTNAIVASTRNFADDVSVETVLQAARNDPVLHAGVERARALIEGYDAADPARASARAIAAEWFSAAGMAGTQARPLGGYPPLLRALERSLDPRWVRLWLSAPATRLVWGRDGVTLTVERHGSRLELRARTAIVTVPLAVLQTPPDEPGAIAFDPPLPPATRRALDALAMGPVLKVLLRFTHAFWEELDGGRYRDATFVQAPQAAFPVCWTQRPLRAPFLACWAGGTRAAALAALDASALALRALATVRAVFPGAPAEDALMGAHVHDWQRDPFARGAYSYALVGGAAAREDLARPQADALLFAGEATATGGYGGTVAGALQSAERAAREVRRIIG